MPFANHEDERSYRARYRVSPSGRVAHARAEKKYADTLKRKVIALFCGSEAHCQCVGCHTAAICFLSIDHIKGNGKEQKTSGGWRQVSKSLWLWILKYYKRHKKLPSGFQILCLNCNYTKRQSSCCPMEGRPH